MGPHQAFSLGGCLPLVEDPVTPPSLTKDAVSLLSNPAHFQRQVKYFASERFILNHIMLP